MKANYDLTVMIHGTFAARDKDDGDSWWQQGSTVWEEFRQRLPRGVRLPRAGEFFHWSGDNKERARMKAGRDLLSYMLKLEEKEQPYHLVGHSHGGSVIWHALRMASLERHSLSLLKSWSTVGTPFLHQRTRGAFNLVNLFNLMLALLLLKPAYASGKKIVSLVASGFAGTGQGIIIPHAESAGLMAFFRAPLLKLLEFLGIALIPTEGGIQVGNFDSSSHGSFLSYLFFSTEGLLILLVILAGLYVYTQLAVFCLSPVLESLRIRAEQRLERQTFHTYGGRWLGIWSPDDEAINGLRATLDLSVSFVAKMVPHERIFFSDRLSLLSQPYYWILGPLFNRFLRPVLDGVVRTQVIKAAQGNNRPSAEVVAVMPAPAGQSANSRSPAIPEALNRTIVTTANEHASDIAPKLRRLLAEPSFFAGMERFGAAISGRELVHTSYFDHGGILELLAMNMAWSRDNAAYFARYLGDEQELLGWFQSFKASVGQSCRLGPFEPPRHEPPPPKWIRPRRRVSKALATLSAD